MKLKLIRHLWGVEKSIEQAFPLFKAEGFEGIERPLLPDAEAPHFFEQLAKHSFEYIGMAFTAGTSVAEHLASFRADTQRAIKQNVKHLTVHSGADWFSHDEAIAFFREAVQIERDLPFVVAHETHRGRILYNPWITRDVVTKVPELKLCTDYSHFVCVAERLLGGCESILSLLANHSAHLHARVGYEEGPQVPDPSAPEYAAHLAAHERWWDEIFAVRKQKGLKEITLTPEFGPPGYLHTLPHTNVPVADLWKVCTWMAHRQQRRFAEKFA